MSTQQDIYAAGFENRPSMLNKDNYVLWSSRLLRYAKSRSNGKLIYNFIMNGPYVRRMIPELGDADREAPANETFHEQTYDELTEKLMIKPFKLYFSVFLKTSMLRLIAVKLLKKSNYNGVDMLPLHTADYTQLYDFFKYNQKEVDELRAERFTKTQDPLALMANSNNPFNYPVFHPDLPSSSIQTKLLNTNQQPENFTKPRDRQIPQPGMNLGQDNQIQTVRGNGGNQFRQYAGQNVKNQNRNGNSVAAPAEGNANGNNEETWIQLQAEEFDLMAVAANLDEIEEVNANCILMANL
nr:hypothetical protein [Tanacetum cinerariifolium]